MINKSLFIETSLKSWASEYLKQHTTLKDYEILNIVQDEFNKMKSKKSFGNRIIKIAKKSR